VNADGVGDDAADPVLLHHVGKIPEGERRRICAAAVLHAPRKIGRDAVIAVAGEVTADAGNCISEQEGGRRRVGDRKKWNFMFSRVANDHDDREKETAVPGQPAGRDRHSRMPEEFIEIFEEEEQFRSADAEHDGDECDGASEIAVVSFSDKFPGDDGAGGNEAERHHQAETVDRHRADFKEDGIHACGYIDKITPAAIYIHCVNNATEKIKLTNELIRIESKHSLERMEIETKIRRIEAEKDELLAERDVLLNELMSFRKEFSDSLGWKLIIRYRKLKDRIAPLRSKRRVFYEMLLKSIKVSRQEGMKGLFFRVRRRVRIHSGLLNYKSTLGKFKPLSFSAESKIRETHCFVKKPVQIIMPVYNGYEYLKDCIKSIFLNTDLKSHTLVIIDDSSTDCRVTAYLKELEEGRDGKRIEILFNTNNQGFVKTINRGMKLSPGDVIILNSDTLVTKNWVDKLRRAAYSKPRVATATPLSNYMTINGIPKPFQYNAIPSGMNVDTFAAFLEDISLLYYPEVPAGVGFCMYIKRDVLEQLGYFDETKFEKGYAEETDFCMRALKQGFVHVLDDSTYIYHVGGVSFESVRDPEIIREKNLMIERNLETLRTLHPEYSSLVKKALDENLAPVHKYINMRAKLMERKLASTLCDRSKT
jgi:GT2 family glycosyltransferase